MFNLSYLTLIAQVKFRPNILSFDGITNIAKDLESKFDEWTAPKNEQIDLYSLGKKEALQIHYNAITYVTEDASNEDKALKYVNKTYKSYSEEFNIKEIRRVGYRKTILYKSDFGFDDLTDLIYKKFYSQEAILRDTTAETIRDVVFVLDGIKDSYKNHIQIGPVKGSELSRYFKSKFDKSEIEMSDETTFLFIDVDFFLSDANNSSQSIEDAFTDLKDHTNKTISKYIEYLES